MEIKIIFIVAVILMQLNSVALIEKYNLSRSNNISSPLVWNITRSLRNIRDLSLGQNKKHKKIMKHRAADVSNKNYTNKVTSFPGGRTERGVCK